MQTNKRNVPRFDYSSTQDLGPGYVATNACVWGREEDGLTHPPVMNGVTVKARVKRRLMIQQAAAKFISFARLHTRCTPWGVRVDKQTTWAYVYSRQAIDIKKITPARF